MSDLAIFFKNNLNFDEDNIENIVFDLNSQNLNSDSLLQYEYDIENIDSENLLQKINKFVENDWEVVDIYSHALLIRRQYEL
ncbi:MAG: hypothetical protein GX362_05600 [Methanosarcinaceae archaeon]|nr:hypothetical protein [Methanosarcinaceae archaeon]